MIIRSMLYGTEAKIFFAAVYKQSNIFSSLFSSNQKEIVIENEKGTFDIIPINSSFKNIKIDGPQGETEIEINNRLVKVTKSTCRHKLCEKSRYAANVGDVIACAPNKVLIRIDEV
ncbi:MAG: NusG domain II-containing protein [Bacteroidetes bacterium]|nr:NusG domain II-containing protein [Bacteroidota bacterium]